MSTKVKASTMIKFGYCMLAFNMIGALVAWLFHDENGRVPMAMIGACIWIVMILIWYKVDEHGKKEDQDINQ